MGPHAFDPEPPVYARGSRHHRLGQPPRVSSSTEDSQKTAVISSAPDDTRDADPASYLYGYRDHLASASGSPPTMNPFAPPLGHDANPLMQSTDAFKDQVALEASRVTPGVGDTEAVQYALYAVSGSPPVSDSFRPSPRNTAPARQHPPRDARLEPGFQSSEPHPTYTPAPVPREFPVDGPPHEADHPGSGDLRTVRKNNVSLATLVQFNITPTLPPLSPNAWTPADRELFRGARAAANPPLSFRPAILCLVPIMSLAVLCGLMAAALVVCAVYSQLQTGLMGFGDIYDGRYFLFRILPQLVGAIPFLFAQSVIAATYRAIPFLRIHSNSEQSLFGALFEDLFPKTFLWPRIISTEVYPPTDPERRPSPIFAAAWPVGTFIVVSWLAGLALPLQGGLFTVVLVDGHWKWATVQGVAWALVAVYVLFFASAVLLALWWKKQDRTGLMWDPRSIADVAALVSHSNTLDDYRRTEVLKTREDFRVVLADRNLDRLGYWTRLQDPSRDIWYSLGSFPDGDRICERLNSKLGYPSSRPANSENDRLVHGSDVDSLQKERQRYLPFALRTPWLLGFTATIFVLLLALFLVSFLPATDVTKGFAPSLDAAPQPGPFSPANFLYSFIPSLIGLLLFLIFQSFEISLRILQPWAELNKKNSTREGAPSSQSLLADYAACYPFQSSWHALKNGHFFLAIISLLGTVFITLPVLGGGIFMALTNSKGQVLMFPNIRVFGLILALLALYLGAVMSLFFVRGRYRMPHAVTSLAEIISLCANEDLHGDETFRELRNKAQLRAKLGGNRVQGDQPRWVLGVCDPPAGGTGIAHRRRRHDHCTLGIQRAGQRFNPSEKLKDTSFESGYADSGHDAGVMHTDCPAEPLRPRE